jgi:hypothetical protein
MGKPRTHSPKIAARYFNNPTGAPKPWGEFLEGSVQERIGGKSIAGKVSANQGTGPSLLPDFDGSMRRGYARLARKHLHLLRNRSGQSEKENYSWRNI